MYVPIYFLISIVPYNSRKTWKENIIYLPDSVRWWPWGEKLYMQKYAMRNFVVAARK